MVEFEIKKNGKEVMKAFFSIEKFQRDLYR